MNTTLLIIRKFLKILNGIKSSYIRSIVHHPFVVLSGTLVMGFFILFVTLWFHPLPNFKDPIKDFLPRGTPISNKRAAKEKLDELIEAKSIFTVDDMVSLFGKYEPVQTSPADDYMDVEYFKNNGFNGFRLENDLLKKRPASKSFNNFALVSSNHDFLGVDESSEENDDMFAHILNTVKSKLNKRKTDAGNASKRNIIYRRKRAQYDNFKEERVFNRTIRDEYLESERDNLQAIRPKTPLFYCEPILSDECAQIIIESKEPASHSLMSLEALTVQCNFIEQYLKPYLTSMLTYQKSLYDIRFESLSSVVTRFVHKSSCAELEPNDVQNFTLTFTYCASIYKQLALYNLMPVPTIEQSEELKLLPMCRDRNLIDSYKYLVNKDFYLSNPSAELKLDQILNPGPNTAELLPQPIVTYSSIYFSINKNDTMFLVPFYRTYLEPNFLHKPFENRFYQIVGVNFDIKIELFNLQIQSISYHHLAVTIVVIFAFMFLIHPRGLTFSLAVLMCILISLFEGYFVYKFLLKHEHFSFLNLFSVFMVLFTSVRGALLFADVWNEARLKFKNYPLMMDNHPSTLADQIVDSNPSVMVGSTPVIQSPRPCRAQSSPEKEMPLVNIPYLENCVAYLYRNVTLPLFVNTLVTLVSLLVNLNSSIVSVRLFCLYAMCAQSCHFFVSLVVIPCTLTIQVKYVRVATTRLKNLACFRDTSLTLKLKNYTNRLACVYQRALEHCLPSLIINYRCYFIPLMLLLGLPGFCFVFYRPGLALTNSAYFQLFTPSNPIEIYDRHFSELCESNGVYFYQLDNLPNMDMSFVFGVRSEPAHDEVGFFGPAESSLSSLEFDTENFDFYDEKSQLWLLNFCKSLKKEPGLIQQTTARDTDANEPDQDENNEAEDDFDNLNLDNLCLIDLFKIVFSRKCTNDANDFVNHLCCDQTFPFDSNLLQQCLRNVTFLERYLLPYQTLLNERLYFNRTNGLIISVEFQLTSVHKWTPNYRNMSAIYEHVERFFQKQQNFKFVDLNADIKPLNSGKSLPKYGFFQSEFEFFDFQRTILNGTIHSFLISLLLLLILIFMATCNVLITLFTVLTLVMSLSTSFGVLVLLGWSVNLIESMGFVLASAVLVDFILLLGVSYTNFIESLHENNDQQEFTTIFFIREHTVKNVIKNVGSTMLASTLVIVACCSALMGSSILIFRLVGVYFCVLTVVSLVYTLFLFAPLCASFGPLTNYCKLVRNNNKRSEKSFIEFRRANSQAIKTVKKLNPNDIGNVICEA